MTTVREPDLMRVSRRELERRLRRILAPALVREVVEDLEAAPEGEDVRQTKPDADMMERAANVIERRKRKAGAR